MNTAPDTDQIVIDNIKDAIRMNLTPNKDEGGEVMPLDEPLLNALFFTLSYYMIERDYHQYVDSTGYTPPLSVFRCY